jgi:hypothetical protein
MEQKSKKAKAVLIQEMKMPIDRAGDFKIAKKSKRTPTRYLLWGLLSVALVAATASAIFFYVQYREVSDDPSTAITERNQAETTRIMDSLKKRLLIGETEAPTVARVDDPARLKSSNQEFYKDVQVGDYLVIYPKRAIIYRESNDQIINFAPIINTSELQPQTPSPSP